MTERQIEVFFDIHNGLPREGPGSCQSTQIAFSLARKLPKSPKILDIGCGPGAQTICLAQITDGAIVAVDNRLSFIDQLKASSAKMGFNDRISPLIADMNNLPFQNDSFDLIWAEGSIFIIGVATGLRKWRPLMKRNATIAFTHVAWIKEDISVEIDEFWKGAYPEIESINANVKTIEEAGFRMSDHFILSESDWWSEYYNPILSKLPALKEKYYRDSEALELIQMEEKEIEMYRRYSDFYGYVFFVAEKEE